MKLLLNQEALDVMKQSIKDHCVYHIPTEDKNMLEFLGDFNCSKLTDCTYAEIDDFILSIDYFNICSASSDIVVGIIVPECLSNYRRV